MQKKTMRKNNSRKKLNVIWPLLAIYFGCVLIRFIFALSTSNFPTVAIDEFLYYSTGRSIATEGSLLFRGQPALYNYIVYPLILSPIYALFPAGVNYYRVIQFWNILLMSLSVFPVYALCRALCGKEKQALGITALIMLLPDFILGQYVLSEAVIYPLFYALMYCAFEYLRQPRLRHAVWIGVLGGLLYCTKPGAVVPAGIALVMMIILAIRKKNGKLLLHTLLCAGCLAGVFLLLVKLLAEAAFGYSGALLGVYDTQVSKYMGYNYDIFWNSLLLYPYYFLLACGILPLAVSLTRLPGYDRPSRHFYLLISLSVVALLIGTAWTVNRPERSNILYIRYVAMYLPLFLAFCFRPADEMRVLRHPRAKNTAVILAGALIVYAAACTLYAGACAGIGEAFDVHFLMSLAALFTDNYKGIANMIVLFCCAGALYLIVQKENERLVNRLCCVSFALIALLSTVNAYAAISTNTDKKLANEALSVHQELGDQDYLYIYSEFRCEYGLDVNSRKNISQVALYEFFNSIQENNGVYVPFVPDSDRGFASKYLSADTDTIVLDEKSYPLVVFSSSVSWHTTSDDSFRVAHFEKGTRIVDSIIGNVDLLSLAPNRPGILLILNDDWVGKPVKLMMDIQSPVAQDITITGLSGASGTRQLDKGRYWYEIQIESAESAYNFSVPKKSISLYGYEITPVSASGN